MQFGPSLDKRKIQGLVSGTLWNEFIELNRMAFADWLPRNGESRCIGYAMRWIKKTYPWIKWVVSFADGTQCGDGTIYRASGFQLIGIKPNAEIWRVPGKGAVASSSLRPGIGTMQYASETRGGSSMQWFANNGAEKLKGYQLRYIYFLDSSVKNRLTAPILPFSEIERHGAGMYLGKPRVRSEDSGTDGTQPSGGGANPTRTL